MIFKLKQPCGGCPFLKDTPTPLHPERLPSIVKDLDEGYTFYCHKTIDYERQLEDNEGDTHFQEDHEKNQFCAGALIYLEKQNRPNQMMRVGERLGLYDRNTLKGHEKVIDSLDERKTID